MHTVVSPTMEIHGGARVNEENVSYSNLEVKNTKMPGRKLEKGG